MKLCCIMKIVVTKRTATLHKQLTQDEYDILVITYKCTWVITGLLPKDSIPINAFFVNSKQWLQVMFTYQSFFLVLTIYSFDFFSGVNYLSS